MPPYELLIANAITILCSAIASGGFWAFLQKKLDHNDAKTKMILGLGHDRLVFLCISYLNRESITKEEYENLHKYLYVPYKELRGNGTVDQLMEQVKKLPIKGSIHFFEGGKHND